MPLVPKVHGVVLKTIVLVEDILDEIVFRGQTVTGFLVKVSHCIFQARIDFGVKGVRPAKRQTVSTDNDPVVHGVEDALQDVIGFHFAIVHILAFSLYIAITVPNRTWLNDRRGIVFIYPARSTRQI